jgi:hypothetical protein
MLCFSYFNFSQFKKAIYDNVCISLTYTHYYSDCEKNLEDQVITIKEPPTSSDSKDPTRYSIFLIYFLSNYYTFFIELTHKIYMNVFSDDESWIEHIMLDIDYLPCPKDVIRWW